jgi:hypothetical protein
MAACNFNINFSSSATDLVQNMKAKITGQGGTAAGDEAAGSFSVSLFGSSISGSYTISGQQMAVIIDHKPFLISCNQIQHYLQSNL